MNCPNCQKLNEKNLILNQKLLDWKNRYKKIDPKIEKEYNKFLIYLLTK